MCNRIIKLQYTNQIPIIIFYFEQYHSDGNTTNMSEQQQHFQLVDGGFQRFQTLYPGLVSDPNWNKIQNILHQQLILIRSEIIEKEAAVSIQIDKVCDNVNNNLEAKTTALKKWDQIAYPIIVLDNQAKNIDLVMQNINEAFNSEQEQELETLEKKRSDIKNKHEVENNAAHFRVTERRKHAETQEQERLEVEREIKEKAAQRAANHNSPQASVVNPLDLLQTASNLNKKSGVTRPKHIRNDGKMTLPKNIGRQSANVNIKGLIGLANLTNRCFMNTIIQCILHVDLMEEYLINAANEKKKRKK